MQAHPETEETRDFSPLSIDPRDDFSPLSIDHRDTAPAVPEPPNGNDRSIVILTFR